MPAAARVGRDILPRLWNSQVGERLGSVPRQVLRDIRKRSPPGATRLDIRAIMSGIYSIASAIAGEMVSMPISASIMLVVGVVVLLHHVQYRNRAFASDVI